jgi:hypothetical protein
MASCGGLPSSQPGWREGGICQVPTRMFPAGHGSGTAAWHGIVAPTGCGTGRLGTGRLMELCILVGSCTQVGGRQPHLGVVHWSVAITVSIKQAPRLSHHASRVRVISRHSQACPACPPINQRKGAQLANSSEQVACSGVDSSSTVDQWCVTLLAPLV